METRRSFLKKVLTGAAVIGAAKLGLDSADAGWFGGKAIDEWVGIGKLQDFPDMAKTKVETAFRKPDGKQLKGLKLIAERRGEQVFVMSTKCTHVGCEVVLQPDGSFLCPCHKALFNASGAATKGPARKPLPWYETRMEGGEVLVNMSKETTPPPV